MIKIAGQSRANKAKSYTCISFSRSCPTYQMPSKISASLGSDKMLGLGGFEVSSDLTFSRTSSCFSGDAFFPLFVKLIASRSSTFGCQKNIGKREIFVRFWILDTVLHGEANSYS